MHPVGKIKDQGYEYDKNDEQQTHITLKWKRHGQKQLGVEHE
jgi:hypothetical protein